MSQLLKHTIKYGTAQLKSKSTIYQALSDGIVEALFSGSTNNGYGLTDGTNPPTTRKVGSRIGTSGYHSFTMTVKKGDYWLVTITAGNPTSIYWRPQI